MNEFDNNNNQFNDDLDNYDSSENEKKQEPTPEAAPSNEPPKVDEQFRQYRPAQEPHYGNSYAQQNYGYGPYSYNQGQYNQGQYGQGISYTPETPKKKTAQKKSGVSGKVIAVACCLTVILSAVFGFGGAYLAARMTDNTSDGSSIGTPNVSDVGSHDTNAPMVIYRDPDSVQTSVEKNGGEAMTFSQVASLVKDSVVEITTEYNVQSAWYNYVTQGAGSGVIIAENGYVITNAHVITGDSGKVADNIIVRLTDGTEYPATTVGFDSDSDIAILKIEAMGLTAAICGNSDDLAVGEELVVVGNPLGELGGTVTNGIVSATERQISVNGVSMTLIQTNAAVSPGNSGGGMFNMQGQLVGIINAKSSGTGVEGLGFAIPVNEALRVTEQLMEYGYVRGKTYIGVGFDEVTSSNSFYFFYGIKPGIYVTQLEEGFNDKTLVVGDRVVAINGTTISTYDEIKAIVTAASVGDILTFQVERSGKLIEVEVTCFEKVPETASSNVQFEQ